MANSQQEVTEVTLSIEQNTSDEFNLENETSSVSMLSHCETKTHNVSCEGNGELPLLVGTFI